MKKIIFIALLFAGGSAGSFAQTPPGPGPSGKFGKPAGTAPYSPGANMMNKGDQQLETRGARQSVKLQLADVIEITFANETGIGPLVQLTFAKMEDYFKGVESVPQKLKVRSTSGFTVSVRTHMNPFFTDNRQKKTMVSVPDMLHLRVPSNETGGVVVYPFGATTYGNLTNSDTKLIQNAHNGNAQTFSVQYQATPKTSFAPGTYSVDVIYTASRN
jgi:hypothetical protein